MKIRQYYQKSYAQLHGHWVQMIWLFVLGLTFSIGAGAILTGWTSATSFLGYLLPLAVSYLLSFVFTLAPTFGALALVKGQPISSNFVWTGFTNKLYPNLAVINVLADITGRILNLLIALCFAGVIPLMRIFQYVINADTLANKVLNEAAAGKVTVNFSLLAAIAFLGGALGFLLNGYFNLWNMTQIMHPGQQFKQNWQLLWQQMKGHQGEFWRIQLSFLPLLILGVFTLGLALLWIAPLNQVMLANFAQENKLLL